MTSQRTGPNSAHTADGEELPPVLVIKQRRLIFANESAERQIRTWEQSHNSETKQRRVTVSNTPIEKAVLCGMTQYSICPKQSAIHARAVYFLHSTIPSVTCLQLSDVSVICRVTYFQFPIQSAFSSIYRSPCRTSTAAYYWFWHAISDIGRCRKFG